ncbi:hypothetical protein PVAG01_05686 [Phlyctema vagabunda]|uniref:Uncharacterized protein n=1 Tax=Phlyctema vagabunda TaxID=108571 RepID=A0ABR4PKU1_9HELO
MDVHELATAALSQVAQSASQHHQVVPGHVVSSRSSPNDATVAPATRVQVDRSMVSKITNENNIAYMSPDLQNGLETDQRPNIAEEPVLQSTASNHSQDTTDGHDTVSTPPTSEGFSSQGTIPDGQLSQLSQLSQLAAAQQPLAPAAATRPGVTIPATGHKRTADGQVKSGTFKSPATPNGLYHRGHSRNASTFSNASSTTSRIGELSSELRTRLSYAMVKVNNGWQSNSIDEVESLASQAGSPTSSNSTLHGRRALLTSPREVMANVQGQTHAIASRLNTIPHPMGDFDLYQQPTRTYEAFWQDHSNKTQSRQSPHLSHLSPPTSQLSLAPPAEIRPTSHSRRSDPKFARPPAIPGQSRSDLSQSGYHTPRTPNGDQNSTLIHTPATQKTLQEQDAIETLLFMSSPGNSGNMGQGLAPPRSRVSPPQTSPLKHEFGSQTRSSQNRRPEFESNRAENGHYNHGRDKLKSKSRTKDIDKLLDEMGDSSSDEDIIIPTFQSPRRLAASRV